MTDSIESIWPSDVVLTCPMCRRRTPFSEPLDPGIFRCRTCDVVVFPRIHQGELRLMIGTSSFLFEPTCWHQVGRKPWSDELMTPVPLESSIKLVGFRAEPNYSGQRCIIVVSRDHEVMGWSDKGKTLPTIAGALHDDFVSLACWLRWEGWAHNRYTMGVVFDVVFYKQKVYVQHQMPLTSFLRGGEDISQSASHNHLAMMAEHRDLKLVNVMPYACIDNSWLLDLPPGEEVTFDHLEQLCAKWEVESVVLKDQHYFWRFGTSRAWMTYQGGDL